MSDRRHWPEVRSSVRPGDVIDGYRDNQSRTYRLFVNKGWRDFSVGSFGGHQITAAECCDLSIEDLRKLSATLDAVIAAHEPWDEPWDEPEVG